MSRRALVTGGAGFIGSAVVRRLLKADWNVRVFDDFSNGSMDNLSDVAVEVHQSDIRDRHAIARACKDMDAVFHLAAVVGNQRSLDDPGRDAEVNMVGTVNVLQAAVAADVPRFIYSSSAACYGETGRDPVIESHPQEPTSPYGASKLAGEKHALAIGRLYPMVVVALRYFNVFGPRQRDDAYGNVIPIFVRHALADEPLLIYGDGTATRDFVTVEDVAEANLRAAETAWGTAVLNIGSGVPTSVRSIAERCIRIAGSSSPIVHQADRPGDVLHCTADISAGRTRLRFSPSIDIDRALHKYIEWVRLEHARPG